MVTEKFDDLITDLDLVSLEEFNYVDYTLIQTRQTRNVISVSGRLFDFGLVSEIPLEGDYFYDWYFKCDIMLILPLKS